MGTLEPDEPITFECVVTGEAVHWSQNTETYSTGPR